MLRRFDSELIRQGFSRITTTPKGIVVIYVGTLEIDGSNFKIEIRVTEPNLVKLPKVYILEAPENFPKTRPHSEEDQALCYLNQEERVIDCYQPQATVEEILFHVRRTISEIKTGIANSHIENEFSSYWVIGGKNYFSSIDYENCEKCFLANGKIADQTKGFLVREIKDFGSYKIEYRRERMTVEEVFPIKFSDRIKWVGAPNMPGTLGEIKTWLKACHPRELAQLDSIIAEKITTEDHRILFVTEKMQCGFAIKFDSIFLNQIIKNKKDNELGKFISGSKGDLIKIERFGVTPMSQNFMLNRNFNSNLFLGKNITLIGLGSIGSQLAFDLARSGGGNGPQGLLTFVDFDMFSAANISRHILGYEYLGMNKAVGTEMKLKRDLAKINIKTFTASVFEVPLNWDSDLIIDATGEEAVSEYLNRQYLVVRQSKKAKLFHTWIRGTGIAVESFIGSPNGACLRCLRKPGLLDMADDFDVRNGLPLEDLKTDGCNSKYTPYSIAVSSIAAAFAMQEIEREFKTVKNFSEFYSRALVDGAKECGRLVANKREDCEACGKNSMME
jgi:hypothetical protein